MINSVMALPQGLWSPCRGHSLQLPLLPCSSRTLVRRLQVSCRFQGEKRAAAATGATKKEKKAEGRRSRRPADQEDDDESEVLTNMTKWAKNKPPGFGVGKEYDTSLEDQILADIDKEEKLRAEAEVRRKDEQEAKKKKEVEEKRKAALKRPEPPDGVRVKVKYLPRKKNIERDLRLLLKNVRGLLHIRPNELGNSKTKDPVCKGNAVLTFVDEKHALSFIDKHQGRKFAFGKVEKQLGFELQKSKKDSSQQQQVAAGPQLRIAEKEVAAKPALDDESEDVDAGAGEESEDSTLEDDYGADSDDSVVVQDSLADAILDTEEDSEDAEEGSSEEEDGLIFRVPESVLKVAKELDEEEDEDSSCSDSGDELIVEDGEKEEDEESGEELESLLGAGDCLEVDMSLPKMDIEEREEILKTSQQKIAELDEQIGKLIKKLKRKQTKKLEQEIIKLREEKIELLEKRILAKVLAAQEVHRRKREKRKQLQAQTDRNRRKLLGDVLSRRSK